MRISLLTTLFLSALLSFFINPSSAEAKKKIYNAKVYSTDGKLYRGTLKSANEKGIYLAGRRDTTTQFINANQIKTVKIKAKNAGSTGFFVGAGLGLAAGATGALERVRARHGNASHSRRVPVVGYRFPGHQAAH